MLLISIQLTSPRCLGNGPPSLPPYLGRGVLWPLLTHFCWLPTRPDKVAQ